MKTSELYSNKEPVGVVVVVLLLLLTPLVGAMATLTGASIALAYFTLAAWKHPSRGIVLILGLTLVLATLIALRMN